MGSSEIEQLPTDSEASLSVHSPPSPPSESDESQEGSQGGEDAQEVDELGVGNLHLNEGGPNTSNDDEDDNPPSPAPDGSAAASPTGQQHSPTHSLIPLVDSNASGSDSATTSSSSASDYSRVDSLSEIWEDDRDVFEPLDARERFLNRLPPSPTMEGIQILSLGRLRESS